MASTGTDGGAAAVAEGSGQPAKTLSQVEQDIETVGEGLRLMLTNQLDAAEKFWEQKTSEASERKIGKGERDPRGAFTFVGALTALLHGLATLENNQLSDALERLQRADELTNLDGEWAGKTVIKGLCMLLMGIVQTLQGSWTQGIWLILRSWLWLRLLEADALTYQGPERSLVRSTALMALGVFNLIVSFMPPYLMRTASWCSGMKGDRETAIGFLRTCHEEEGLLAPFAVLVLVGYEVDVRTFLGEPHSDEAFAKADKTLSWAEERFPGGIFFEGLRANFHAVSRNVEKALEVSNHMAPMSKELPALGLVMHARRAAYAQANMEFSKAALAFREALGIYQKVDRRSMVPAMAANAALCHELAGEPEQRDEMIELVFEYKARQDKKNWGKPDKWAFGLAEQARSGSWEPQLDLFQLMTVKHRSTLFMAPAKTEELLTLLRQTADGCNGNSDKKCRCLFLQAEILRQRSSFEEALRVCEKGLALQAALSEQGQKRGYVPYMHFISAASHFYLSNLRDAKESLRKLDSCPKKHDLYYPVLFKASQLSRRLGLEMKDTYLEVAVPNRNKLKLAAKVPADVGTVEWEYTLAEFSITFAATFEPEGGGETLRLQSIGKHEATSGPVTGSFEPSGAGTLVLTFDNTFSILRGKNVLCRVQPEHLLLMPVD